MRECGYGERPSAAQAIEQLPTIKRAEVLTLTPDPRSNGFDATPPETLRRLSKSQQAQYFNIGYFLLKDALSLNEVEAMREAGDVLKLSVRRNYVASMTGTF